MTALEKLKLPPVITAVIVTRGDVDLGPCLSGLRGVVDETIIRVGHGGCWERYEAAMDARNGVIVTVDDDAIVPLGEVVGAYEYGKVTCNMPAWKRSEYPGKVQLVGWGAVFHKDALEAFQKYTSAGCSKDALFRREADRVFTGLNDCKLIDVPFLHCDWASGKDRMGVQPEHHGARQSIEKRIATVRRFHGMDAD